MNGCRLFLLAGLLASAMAVGSALAQSVPTYGPSLVASTPTADTTTVRALGTTTKPAVSVRNAVIEWNRTLLAIVWRKAPQRLQPPTIYASRACAMRHLGIYDAVVAVDAGNPDLPEHILKRAASADQAARDVLVSPASTEKAR